MQSATWSVANDAKQGKVLHIIKTEKKHGNSYNRSNEMNVAS